VAVALIQAGGEPEIVAALISRQHRYALFDDRETAAGYHKSILYSSSLD
jgi:hypothetical protein